MTNNKIGKKKEIRELWIAIALLFSISLAIGDFHYHRIDKPHLEARLKLHREIIDGSAKAPYRYRILVPFVMEGMLKILPQSISTNKRFLLSYSAYNITVVFFMLILLFTYMRLWFTIQQSLVGILFVCSTIVVAMKNHFYQPWSFLETALFTFGLLAIFKKKYFLFAVLVVLATLNRATGLFLTLAYLLISINMGVSQDNKGMPPLLNRQDFLRFLVYFMLWLTIFFGLRWILGESGSVHTIKELWILNTNPVRLLHASINIAMFLGLFWLFILLGFRCSPSYVRKTVRIVPFYILVIAIYGVWKEVRLLMVLYPIIVPLGLSFIYPKEKMAQVS